MACFCKNKKINDKTPETPCIFCAHKHISTAMQLYGREIGYTSINRSDAIGQLILAAWHYDKAHHELALQCRDIWLKIERLQDVAEELELLQRIAWDLVIRDVTAPESPDLRQVPMS